MANRIRLSLLHDRQTVPVLCRCAVCGGEIYEDGIYFQAYPMRVCWFCLQRAHLEFHRQNAAELTQ